ncbi:MAG: hypothetical protein AAF938_14090 [Myxococcota bacterium]
MRGLWILVLASAALACGDDTVSGCLRPDDCSSGQVCVAGECRSSREAGTVDRGVDGSVVDDASADETGAEAGLEIGVEAGPDGAGCGLPCERESTCEAGILDCSEDPPRCVPDGPQPEGTVCRAADGPCDVEDRCDGTSVVCQDSAAEFGSACEVCEGGECEAGFCDSGTCELGCTAGVPCNPTPCTTGVVMCSADGMPSCAPMGNVEDGTSCGADTVSEGACVWRGGTCGESGARPITTTRLQCQSGACAPVDSVEMINCTRDTDGTGCGSDTFGDWGGCNYADACDQDASESRTVTSRVCGGGSCGTTERQEMRACTRNTDGTTCGAPSDPAWSPCNFGTICTTSGSQSRTVVLRRCGGGSCGNVNDPQTRTCTRGSQAGVRCGDAIVGGYGPCGATGPVNNSCSSAGRQSRTTRQPVCGSTGSCNDETTSSSSRPCSYDPTGDACVFELAPGEPEIGICDGPGNCEPAFL